MTTMLSSVGVAFFYVAAGLAMLVTGGEFLVSGATRLARLLGMSTLMIGLTVVAFGTSVPELFVSLTASLQGYPDIMIGNIVGSNIANIGLILGLTAILARLNLDLQEVWVELLLVIAGSVILILCTSLGYFPRYVGFVFIITLAIYTVLACGNSRNDKAADTIHNQESTNIQAVLFSLALITGGLILLALGANIFIRGAADVARFFGVSELVIGLTLAAIGTSLPELASSLSALRRNESNLLIGNIIGSNMFNLFMVLGLTAAVEPFPLSPHLLQRDLPVMMGFTLALVAVLRRRGGTRRWHGLLFLGSYGIYCISLL